VLKASLYGEAKINLTEKIVRLFKGMGKLALINKLRITANSMREFKEFYLHYPNPQQFIVWKERVEQFYSEKKAEFGPSPIRH